MLKETSTQRLAGRRRKTVINKKEMMYIPLLDTLQSLLNNATVLEEVSYLLFIDLQGNKLCALTLLCAWMWYANICMQTAVLLC